MKIKIYPALIVGTFLAFFAFGLSAKTANAQIACAADINFDANPKTVRADQEIVFSGWVKSTQFNSAGSGAGEGYCNFESGRGIIIRSFHLQIRDKDRSVTLFSADIPLTQYSNGQLSFRTSGITLDRLGYAGGQELNVVARALVANTTLSKPIRESAAIKVTVTSAPSTNYACVAGDGKYACGQRSDCSDVPNNACAGKTCMQVNSSYCGKAVVFTVTPDQTFKLGDKFRLTLTNLPPGWTAKISINGKRELSIASESSQIDITEANGFTKTGQNQVILSVFDNRAQNITLNNLGNITITTSETGTPVTPGPGTPSGTPATTTLPTDRLYNPLPEEDLTKMFLLITRGFIFIIGMWAVMFIIIGGFRMITAAGNEEAYGQAKKTVTWAVLGLVIAMLSFSIIAIVQNLLQATVK